VVIILYGVFVIILEVATSPILGVGNHIYDLLFKAKVVLCLGNN